MYALYISNSIYTPCFIILGNNLIKATNKSEKPLGGQKSRLFLMSRAIRTGSLRKARIPISTADDPLVEKNAFVHRSCTR